MLAYKYRFHGHGSLRYLFNKGKTARSRHLMLRYVPNPNRVHPRVAVVVSKKVFKAAAKRNRARRRIFEIVRHELENISMAHDFTITVFSAEVITLPHEELRAEVLQLLSTAKLLGGGHRTDNSLSS